MIFFSSLCNKSLSREYRLQNVMGVYRIYIKNDHWPFSVCNVYQDNLRLQLQDNL